MLRTGSGTVTVFADKRPRFDLQSEASADFDKAELAQYARSQLQDYYTEACRILPEADADLKRIEGLSPDEMIAEAERNSLL